MTNYKVICIFVVAFSLFGNGVHCQDDDDACTEVVLDSKGLSKDLKTKLYGQHLVSKAILTHLKGHFKDQNPGKPLVLSLNGCTGVGKNFVAQIIRDNTYKGAAKKHFHIFNSEIHFKHNQPQYLITYKDQLHSWIYHNVSNCARSMFVFDELDHMPNGLLDVLTPFLDHNDNVDGVDFRKAVFIFLSNSGSIGVTKGVSEHINAGNNRSSLTTKEMQKMLSGVAYNEQGGFKYSKLIKKSLVDHFIPFLPLEREHVSDCVRDMVRQKYDITIPTEKINKVLDQIEWKTNDKSMFASYGCKNIETHVRAMAEDILEEEEDDKHDEL